MGLLPVSKLRNAARELLIREPLRAIRLGRKGWRGRVAVLGRVFSSLESPAGAELLLSGSM